MSIENMKMVSEAEAQAVTIRTDAQTEARKTLDAGRKEAAALLEAARVRADEAYRQALAKAEEEAQEAYDAHLKAVKEECAGMKAQAQGHKEEAVKRIIGKVVGTGGYC